MRARWKWILSLCVLLLFIQLFQPERTNPAINPANTIEARLSVPSSVSATLASSCNDCHSNATVWPWYSHIAPASWLIASDVNRGRAELNFSEWNSYPAEKQPEMLKEICSEVTNREMPQFTYLFFHPSAKLTRANVGAICDWTKALNHVAPALPENE